MRARLTITLKCVIMRPMNLSTKILTGPAAGMGCGLFFGDYCANLSIVGTALIGLLRMTVPSPASNAVLISRNRPTMRRLRDWKPDERQTLQW